MSRSLRPWLQERLLDDARVVVAGSLDSAPFRSGSRVQIARFLTFRSEDEPGKDIWAQVCDKTHFIAARFTGESVDAFQRVSPFLRFTQARGAILAIRSCRCTVARVQTQIDAVSSGMPRRTFILEVEAFELLGGLQDSVHFPSVVDVVYFEGRTPEVVLGLSELQTWAHQEGLP